MRDMPIPRERYEKYWTIIMPDGKERGKYESEDEAGDQALEIMGDQELEQIEIAQIRVTSGGTYLNWGIEITESKLLINHETC